MNENYPMQAATTGLDKRADMARRADVTLRQNIDTQIKAAEDHVASLKATKQRLENSNLLDTRIDDLQQAMRW